MYTFSSCRQAHQHRQLQVNLFFSLLELLSTPSPLQPRTGPCHTVRRPQVRGERLPQAVGGEWGQWREKWPGSTLPWGQRERKRKVGPGKRREWDDGGSRHSRGREGEVTP